MQMIDELAIEVLYNLREKLNMIFKMISFRI